MMRLFPLLSLFTLACGIDTATANGELGRMTFTLVSDYYLDEHDITESSIVTGHEQSFIVELTGMGEGDAGNEADEIEYVVTPDDGVTLSQQGPDEDSGDDDRDSDVATNFEITVDEPGDYVLEARLAGETFDRIQLGFDVPDQLEIAAYLRAPWEEDFERMTDPAEAESVLVEAGTQLAWLPIPLGVDGSRLLGNLSVDMSADSENMVVPSANVDHVNEDEVQTFFAAASLFFVNVGDVTVTLTDTQNAAAGSIPFQVEALSE